MHGCGINMEHMWFDVVLAALVISAMMLARQRALHGAGAKHAAGGFGGAKAVIWKPCMTNI